MRKKSNRNDDSKKTSRNGHEMGCGFRSIIPFAPSVFARPGHPVPDPAHGLDVGGVVRVVAEFLAKLLDEGPHERLRLVEGPPAPDLAQQGVVGHDPAGAEREQAQQLVLAGGELDRAPGHAHPAPIVVDGEGRPARTGRAARAGVAPPGPGR